MNSEVKTKKGFLYKICAKFHNFRDEDHKKGALHCEICEKTVLAHEYWVDDQYFGGLRPRSALQWHRASYFL